MLVDEGTIEFIDEEHKNNTLNWNDKAAARSTDLERPKIVSPFLGANFGLLSVTQVNFAGPISVDVPINSYVALGAMAPPPISENEYTLYTVKMWITHTTGFMTYYPGFTTKKRADVTRDGSTSRSTPFLPNNDAVWNLLPTKGAYGSGARVDVPIGLRLGNSLQTEDWLVFGVVAQQRSTDAATNVHGRIVVRRWVHPQRITRPDLS